MPILRAYNWPAILAPVGSWVDTPLNQTVDFAGVPRKRSEFLTWEQIREVSKSGLVEIAAHTDANHKGVLANPQGNQQPAATTRRYDPVTGGYETEADFQARLRKDVVAISEKFARSPATARASGSGLTGSRRHGVASDWQRGLSNGPDPGRRSRQPG